MHDELAVEVVAHNFNDDRSNVAGLVTVSLASGEITWLASKAPDEVSLMAPGAAGIVGVSVGVDFCPVMSCT